MSRGVIYLLTGAAHAARMVVSLWNLRKRNTDLPVTVYTTTKESHLVAQHCIGDSRLGNVNHRITTELAIRKNRQFITKVHLLPVSPYDVVLYLDCDTLPIADVSPVLDAAEQYGFAATQFCNWVTTGSKITKRLTSLVDCIDDDNQIKQSAERQRDDCLSHPYPSVNGGVFATRRDAPILLEWYRLAMAGRRSFICDESALHLVLRDHEHTIMEGGHWNCSGHLGGEVEKTGPVNIWHFHGEKHIKRDSSREIWLPAFTECWDLDVAGIRSWAPLGDGDLEKYLRGGAMVS